MDLRASICENFILLGDFNADTKYVASNDFRNFIFLLASSTSLLFGQTILSRLELSLFMKWWSVIKNINILSTILSETLCIHASGNIPSIENTFVKYLQNSKPINLLNSIVADNIVELRRLPTLKDQGTDI